MPTIEERLDGLDSVMDQILTHLREQVRVGTKANENFHQYNMTVEKRNDDICRMVNTLIEFAKPSANNDTERTKLITTFATALLKTDLPQNICSDEKVRYVVDLAVALADSVLRQKKEVAL
jgi:hypothetical protein